MRPGLRHAGGKCSDGKRHLVVKHASRERRHYAGTGGTSTVCSRGIARTPRPTISATTTLGMTFNAHGTAQNVRTWRWRPRLRLGGGCGGPRGCGGHGYGGYGGGGGGHGYGGGGGGSRCTHACRAIFDANRCRACSTSEIISESGVEAPARAAVAVAGAAWQRRQRRCNR